LVEFQCHPPFDESNSVLQKVRRWSAWFCRLTAWTFLSLVRGILEGSSRHKPGPTPSLSGLKNDPETTGYNPAGGWRNYYNIITGRMTDAGKHRFREDSYIRNEAADCNRCDEWKAYMFKHSPTVRFLSENITALNGKLDNDNVRCQRCVTRVVEDKDENGNTVEKYMRQGGGFSPDHGILICANEMRNKGHMEDTLAHEMIHAWDHLRFKVDWTDLRHAACTEVRRVSFDPLKHFQFCSVLVVVSLQYHL
jgi:inner membrane protease ATP23